jgi:hypothetical protein
MDMTRTGQGYGVKTDSNRRKGKSRPVGWERNIQKLLVEFYNKD